MPTTHEFDASKYCATRRIKYIDLMQSISIKALQAAILDDAASRAFLRNLRWPHGFQCPTCGSTEGHEVVNGRFWSCSSHGCRYRTCMRVGTFLEGSRKPVQTWLKALHAFLLSEQGLTAAQLRAATRDQISLPTAWNWLQRFRTALQRDRGLDRSSIASRFPKPTRGSAWSLPKSSRGALIWLRSRPPLDKTSRKLSEWLLSVYAGRVSTKHLRAYWMEYRFRSVTPPSARWRRFLNCLDRSQLSVLGSAKNRGGPDSFKRALAKAAR